MRKSRANQQGAHRPPCDIRFAKDVAAPREMNLQRDRAQGGSHDLGMEEETPHAVQRLDARHGIERQEKIGGPSTGGYCSPLPNSLAVNGRSRLALR